MTYEDITSIDTRPLRGQQLVVSAETPSRPYVVPSPAAERRARLVRGVVPPAGPTAIAEAEVLRLELQDLAEQRDALTLRVAELGVENANLASQCARLRMQLAEVRGAA